MEPQAISLAVPVNVEEPLFVGLIFIGRAQDPFQLELLLETGLVTGACLKLGSGLIVLVQ